MRIIRGDIEIKGPIHLSDVFMFANRLCEVCLICKVIVKMRQMEQALHQRVAKL